MFKIRPSGTSVIWDAGRLGQHHIEGGSWIMTNQMSREYKYDLCSFILVFYFLLSYDLPNVQYGVFINLCQIFHTDHNKAFVHNIMKTKIIFLWKCNVTKFCYFSSKSTCFIIFQVQIQHIISTNISTEIAQVKLYTKSAPNQITNKSARMPQSARVKWELRGREAMHKSGAELLTI